MCLTALSAGCGGASLLSELRHENLGFVEIAAFGSFETLDPLDRVFKIHELPDRSSLVGVSSAGNRLLILGDSHRTPEGPQTPKIYDEVEVTTLEGSVLSSFLPNVYRMLAYSAELSPEGQMIAFRGDFVTRDGRGGYGLHLLHISGEIRTLVATSEAKVPQSIGWAKDGRTIVYDLDSRILLYHLDTNNSSFLTDGCQPAWSPDGKMIAYRTLQGTAALISPDGTLKKNILGNTQLGGGLKWSPDSRYVLYTDLVRGGIRVLEIATGRIETVFAPVDRNYTESRLRWVRGKLP